MVKLNIEKEEIKKRDPIKVGDWFLISSNKGYEEIVVIAQVESGLINLIGINEAEANRCSDNVPWNLNGSTYTDLSDECIKKLFKEYNYKKVDVTINVKIK